MEYTGIITLFKQNDKTKIKLIFEYYEKINKIVYIKFINFINCISLVNIDKTITLWFTVDTQYTSSTFNNRIVMKPISFYQISLEYAIKKRIKKQINFDTQNFYIYNNNINYNHYSPNIYYTVELNYIVYIPLIM